MTPNNQPAHHSTFMNSIAIQAYLDRGEEKTAVFEFFRTATAGTAQLPACRGLEDTLAYLGNAALFDRRNRLAQKHRTVLATT